MTWVVDRFASVFRLILRAPQWLQPPLLGVTAVYGFMVAAGSLVLIPLTFLYIAFRHPQDSRLQQWPIHLRAPAAGFLGGLAYGLVGLIVGREGKPSYVDTLHCGYLRLLHNPCIHHYATGRSRDNGRHVSNRELDHRARHGARSRYRLGHDHLRVRYWRRLTSACCWRRLRLDR